MEEGVWRGVQFALNPFNPIPLRESVLQSLVAGLLARVCSKAGEHVDVDEFRKVLTGVCSMASRFSYICKDVEEKLREVQRSSNPPKLCTVVRELLSMYSNTSPRLRLAQQALVVTALVGMLYKFEAFTPLERLEHYIPPEEEAEI